MKTLSTFLLALLSISIICSNCKNSEKPKTAEELKAELKQREQSDPLSYISDEKVVLTPQQKQTRKEGLFHRAEYAPDGAIIEGDLVNKATLAKFKDIVVQISFLSQTETVIEEKSYVLYQYLEPNSSKHFSIKIDELPQAYKNFGLSVTGATQVDN